MNNDWKGHGACEHAKKQKYDYMVKKTSFSEQHMSYIVQDNMSISPKIVVIIPIYNESQVIHEVIIGIKNAGYDNIVIVDDGSADNSFLTLQKLPVITLRHRINRGKGAALRTGLEAAKIINADIVITMDGDGQHDPSDIDVFVKTFLNKKVDVVLGVRQIQKENMPISRRAANWIADKVTFILYGIHIRDSQSGFRGYSSHAIQKIRMKVKYCVKYGNIVFHMQKFQFMFVTPHIQRPRSTSKT